MNALWRDHYCSSMQSTAQALQWAKVRNRSCHETSWEASRTLCSGNGSIQRATVCSHLARGCRQARRYPLPCPDCKKADEASCIKSDINTKLITTTTTTINRGNYSAKEPMAPCATVPLMTAAHSWLEQREMQLALGTLHGPLDVLGLAPCGAQRKDPVAGTDLLVLLGGLVVPRHCSALDALHKDGGHGRAGLLLEPQAQRHGLVAPVKDEGHGHATLEPALHLGRRAKLRDHRVRVVGGVHGHEKVVHPDLLLWLGIRVVLGKRAAKDSEHDQPLRVLPV
mmetsp:Transcript_127960/g.398461  ORF Transcript_127960/g.398461 Transcript_127960/m.398461 type:complete len:282 (-) Transcript_127960:64-909(-)